MIKSMTGYGHGEAVAKGKKASAEIRSVNSRFLELTIRLPKELAHREGDVKEIVQQKLDRGKINLTVNLDSEIEHRSALVINKDAVKHYYKLLNDLKKSVNLKEEITIDHLLKFSEIIQPEEKQIEEEFDWNLCEKAIIKALDNLIKMRENEGNELAKDLIKRINNIEKNILKIEKISRKRIPIERNNLRAKVKKLLEDKDKIDEQRLELEIIFLAEKLDITEECVRIKSHKKYFIDTMKLTEPSGRKLNFLVQEIHREVNTIGAKSNDASISQLTIEIKEELEKIREQLQNIE